MSSDSPFHASRKPKTGSGYDFSTAHSDVVNMVWKGSKTYKFVFSQLSSASQTGSKPQAVEFRNDLECAEIVV